MTYQYFSITTLQNEVAAKSALNSISEIVMSQMLPVLREC